MYIYEYIRLLLKLPIEEIIVHYGPKGVEHNGHINGEKIKGLYGPPQASRTANDFITKKLSTHGYYQCRHTAFLWKHKQWTVIFSLVVDDFEFKYIGVQHAGHLIESIRKYYLVDIDCNGAMYCCIKLGWKYSHPRSFDLSMSKYVPKILHEFQHSYTKRLQHALHKWEFPNYGSKTQWAK